MRTLFRKNNYKVYLVDEFRTSCMCSICGIGICEKFMVRKNPRPENDDLRYTGCFAVRADVVCGTETVMEHQIFTKYHIML
jgi:hypothetical protein